MSEIVKQNLENQFDREHAAEVFERFAEEPGMKLDQLHSGQSVELYKAAPIANDESGHSALAVLEIPRDTDSSSKEISNSYLILGHSERSGYYLYGHNGDPEQLDLYAEEHAVNLNTMPLQIGNGLGDKMILGRDNVAFIPRKEAPFTSDMKNVRSMKGEFGNATSRKHLEFEITPTGIRVTDASTNGTRLLSHNIQRVSQ